MATSYLHERLTRSLLEEMASGAYREGQLFLSLRTICRLWKVSEPTVVTSLRKLSEEGLLRSMPRRGYFFCNGFQQKAQILLRRNRIEALKPPLSLQQKMRVLQNVRGGKVALLLETVPTTSVPNKAIGFFPPSELRKAACAFEKEGRRYGFECQWFPYVGDKADAKLLREQLEEGDFHGAVVYCRSDHETIEWMLGPLLARQLPVVVIYDDCAGLPVNSINLNNVGLGHDAIRQLYRMGHRRIAVVTRTSPLKVHAARLKGCLLAHSEGGCHDADLQILKLSPTKSLSAEIRRYFANPVRRPTAVFSSESRLLAKLAPLWNDLGISVPEDISVIAASSRTTLNGFHVPLDVMQLKVGSRIGRLAAKLLHRIQAGEALERSVLLDVNYIKRGSVRKIMAPLAASPTPSRKRAPKPTQIGNPPPRKRRRRRKVKNTPQW